MEEGTVKAGMFRSRGALDLRHQPLADTSGLNIGSHEDGPDDASVKACRSNDAGADGGDENGAFSDQLAYGARTETTLDPFDGLVGIVFCIRLAQRTQDDTADVIGVIFKREPDRAVHGSFN